MTKRTDINSIGTLYGVGLGPGDPELLTLKALRIIREVPVIAIPSANHEDGSTAEGILVKALELSQSAGAADALKDKELLRLELPMTKDEARLIKARRAAAESIVMRLKEGKDVAFITLGDPMFFSTFSYLMPFVSKLCPEAGFKTVPGVTAPGAASAALNTALAEGDDKVIIVPASLDLEGARAALANFDSIVLMKVSKVIDRLLDLLDELGLTESAVFISKASWADEVIVRDISTLRGTKPSYFSMIIVTKRGF
ncbi:MAG: precorrin-2 C(20)-methyltransferase [Thermodesulfobacteriota bacterium]